MLGPLASTGATMGLALIAWQGYVIGREYYLRRTRYAKARNAARRRGKPLLVVGRPGARLRIYGCGDVTLDLEPKVLKDCPQGGVVGDVRSLNFNDGQFGAAFCSHVLDCLGTPSDVEQAYRELHRVADEVFLCTTSPQNIFWRWLSPEVSVWIRERQGLIMAQPHPLRSLWSRWARALQR